MKIGIDASRYTTSGATGVEWYSWYIINHLIQLLSSQKNDVFLYSRYHLNYEKDTNKLIKASKGQFQNRVLTTRRLWTLIGLSKEMKQNPPDVLFVPSHVLPLVRPEKSVITIHDVAFRHLRSSYSVFQYLYLNWSTKYAVKNATKIIVPSDATKKDLVDLYDCRSSKIEVVQHGFVELKVENLDLQFDKSDVFKHFEITKKTKFLLFVGRLESKKNLVRLVDAFEKVSHKEPDYKLVLAGKRGVGFNDIWQRVKHLKLDKKVLMPGYISEEEKFALFKHCKAFVFPSLYEGFGFPVLEAFHFKKPVLASNFSSLPEVGGDCVHYVDPNSTEDIEKGISKLLSDEVYVQKLVDKGDKRLRNFTWEKAAEKTLNIIYG